MTKSLREEPLTKYHQRSGFDCGNTALNTFLQRYARQSHDKATAKTYVTLNEQDKILGFYTLTITSISHKNLPEALQKRLGYHDVPLFTLARLAVDTTYQGQGLGGALLYRAIQRCAKVAEQVGGIGLLIDAKDENVAQWYQSYGAIPLPNNPLSLILLFETAKI